MIRALLLAVLPLAEAVAQTSNPVEAVAAGHALDRMGDVIVGRGDTIVYDSTGDRDRLWRWASVTKQVVAVLVMRQVALGRIALDRPVSDYLPRFAGPNAKTITVRQLLRHQSGLPNPDDTPANGAGIPAYDAPGYASSRDPLTGYCAGPAKRAPGGNWEYNNCDFIVAGALLEAVTGKPWARLVRDEIARPFGLKTVGAYPTRKPLVPATVGGRPEPAIDMTAFAASAGLYGSARDLWRFDRALMTGALLPEAQRAEMWDGQPQLGSIALGQWSYAVPLKGCAAPVRIVERRGGIGGIEVRNFILPDKDIAAIVFVNRDGVEFGELWQGKGISYDLVSAAACA